MAHSKYTARESDNCICFEKQWTNHKVLLFIWSENRASITARKLFYSFCSHFEEHSSDYRSQITYKYIIRMTWWIPTVPSFSNLKYYHFVKLIFFILILRNIEKKSKSSESSFSPQLQVSILFYDKFEAIKL